MLQIFSTTLPIFILMAVGFLAVYSKLLSKDALTGIGKYVLYFAMPALIFETLSKSNFADIIDPYFLSAYGVGSLACFILFFLFFRVVFRDSVTISGLKGFGSAMSNNIYIGYPMLIFVMDEPPIAAFAMALVIENFLIFPLALIVMDFGVGSKLQQNPIGLLKGIGERLIKNPILLAIFAGSLVSSNNIELPSFISRIVEWLAQSSPAAALFFVGGMLVGTSLKGSNRSIAAVSIGKLFVHPFLVAICILLLPDFNYQLQTAAILLAVSPMVAFFPIIGSQYDQGPLSANIMLITTMFSFVTIPIILWIISLQ